MEFYKVARLHDDVDCIQLCVCDEAEDEISTLEKLPTET